MMQRSKPFFRWLAGCLLLFMLLDLLGETGLSARAAPQGQTASREILINEVAWAGTQASSDDDWIELYNPGAADLDISNWELISTTFSITFPVPTVIPANSFYLIERRERATDVASNLIFSNLLLGNRDTLRLRRPNGSLIDSANQNGGPWPAGDAATNATMQRGADVPDDDLAWVTYEGPGGPELDAANNPILGTPGRVNQPTNVTATPVPATSTPTATLTRTPTNTPTATRTNTPTSTGVVTPTRTSTPTRTQSPTPNPGLIIVINEVAWAGTGSSENLANDEWIELYNPSGTTAVNISGWKLFGNNFEIVFPAGTRIGRKQFFLIEIRERATNVSSDLIFPDLDLLDLNDRLYLYDTKSNRIIDRANFDGGAWPAGNATTFATMERSVIAEDSNRVWVTYDVNRDSGTKAENAIGNAILGTPGRANRPINVTATSTPAPTSTPVTRFSTVVPPLPPILGISEFLPRPGFDWNNDGLVDVFDEFIEIINAGQIDVNLSAYRLDDEEDFGSVPFTLPNVTLRPDERAVFYASETGILLSDAGDTVRLLRGSTVVDAYTYTVVRYPDQSWCRLPDRLGYWYDPCFPTPNNPNVLTGTVPQPPIPVTGYLPPVCLLPDTTPQEFVYAECEVGGNGIWNRQYWDSADEARHLIWYEEQKWVTFFE